jgi:hypothetical protein
MSPPRCGYLCVIAGLTAAGTAPAEAGKIDIAAGLSANGFRLLDGDGLAPPAYGPGISVMALEPSSLGIALGLDVSAQFASGDNALISDFGASFIWSWLFRDRDFAPFVSLGLSAAAISLDEPRLKGGEQHTRDLAIGVHGNAGIHGYAGDSWMWRVQVGYLGAGVTGFRSQVWIGYRFSEL